MKEIRFIANQHYGCEALCVILSCITTVDETTFLAVKIKETIGTRI